MSPFAVIQEALRYGKSHMPQARWDAAQESLADLRRLLAEIKAALDSTEMIREACDVLARRIQALT